MCMVEFQWLQIASVVSQTCMEEHSNNTLKEVLGILGELKLLPSDVNKQTNKHHYLLMECDAQFSGMCMEKNCTCNLHLEYTTRVNTDCLIRIRDSYREEGDSPPFKSAQVS